MTRYRLFAGLLSLALLPALARADVVDTVWVRRYARSGYCNDEATAMHVDGAGNVYVAGSSQRSEGGLKDYAVVKYNSAGVQQWAERYSSDGNAIPSAIAVDNTGNVYVTGAGESTGTNWDVLTVKYNASGVLQWHDRYNGAANGEDRATSICPDDLGNVAICGWTTGVSSYHDWITIGYSPDGGRRFVTPRTSAGGNPDEANGIVADPQGNYYVAGRFWFPNHVDDATVIKYNSTGGEQWVANYDGPLSGDGAVAVCRSAAGDLYATGWSTGPADNTDIVTIKVSAAGALQWAKRYAAPENANDIGTRITVDGDGNVRVLGRVQVSSGADYDVVTLGYAPDSSEQFVNRLGSGGYGQPGGIALDRDGHTIVSGSIAGDWTTLRYDGTAEVWRRTENWGSGDHAVAVAVDDSGYVYVTGRGDFGANAWDFVTIKYNTHAGVEEAQNAELRAPNAGPTLVRGILRLPSSLLPATCYLLSPDGRKVMDLAPGPNDISRLSPGVYLVRSASRDGRDASVITKVVVTK